MTLDADAPNRHHGREPYSRFLHPHYRPICSLQYHRALPAAPRRNAERSFHKEPQRPDGFGWREPGYRHRGEGHGAGLARPPSRPARRRIALGADKAYDVTAFIEDLRNRSVTPHIAVAGHLSKTGKPRKTTIGSWPPAPLRHLLLCWRWQCPSKSYGGNWVMTV